MVTSREHRAERLQERAQIMRAKAENLSNEASHMAEAIPFGQPVHGQRDRNYRERIQAKAEAAANTYEQASELERRAQAAASNQAIYADDPEALKEIDAKLEKLKALRETMKQCNRLVRKNDHEGLFAILKDPVKVEELFKPDFCGRIGFPDYAFTNLGANIRRLEKRREELVKLKTAAMAEYMIGDVRVVENPAIARIQLFYPDKPDYSTRETLKHWGFRWAPSEGAWQRQLNNAGRHAVRQVLKAK